MAQPGSQKSGFVGAEPRVRRITARQKIDARRMKPAGIRRARRPSYKSLETMLAESELDAAPHSGFAKPFLTKH